MYRATQRTGSGFLVELQINTHMKGLCRTKEKNSMVVVKALVGPM